MAVVALLATTAVPIAVAGPQTAVGRSSRPLDGQSLEIPQDAVAAALPTDEYAVTSGRELRAQEAITRMRTAATFVNDLSSAVQWPFPAGVPITDRFGPREAPCSGCSTFHKGLDLTPGEGTPITAVADGVVRSAAESDAGLGVNATIEHRVDGRVYTSVYAHMQFGSLALAAGQTVRVGDAVGAVGNSGQSTGPHLHLEIWEDGTTPVDPYAWLTENVGR